MAVLRHSRVDEAQRKALQATAYHEAGHAVAYNTLRLRFKYVTIVPEQEKGWLGHILGDSPSHFTRDYLESGGMVGDALVDTVDKVAVRRFLWRLAARKRRARLDVERRVIGCLAGVMAEEKFTGEFNYEGAHSDYTSFIDFASATGNYVLAPQECSGKSEMDVRQYEREMQDKTAALLDSSWQAVEAVALALLERKRLDHREARRIIRETMRR